MSRVRRRIETLQERANGVLPGPVRVGFLTLYVHTRAGLGRVDAVAAREYWGRWTDAAIGALLAMQAGGLALVAAAAWQALGRSRETALNDPVNTVAIPGVNEFMPLSAAPYVVLALVVATAVHEVGHAIACRHEGVSVREWGVALLFGVVPLAAYVLPGDDLDDAPVRSRMRVYAVGVFHNALVAAAASAVLLTPATAGPTDAYAVYFGWALVGGTAPDAAAVASLGVLTNACFWIALLNANFGLLNALPVPVFDGGRVLALSLRRAGAAAGRPLSLRRETWLVRGAGVVAASLVVLAVVGPALRL